MLYLQQHWLIVSCLLLIQSCSEAHQWPLKIEEVPPFSRLAQQFDPVFPRTWEVLGPFQVGTREATWGADPLEYYGGFRNLSFAPDTNFPSAITPNGTVKWGLVEAANIESHHIGASVVLDVQFPGVDWKLLQHVYGWSVLQYQAWVRGRIMIPQTVARKSSWILYTDSILEFWVDGRHHFGGDFYSQRKAPLVLHLEPGPHRLDVRLIRDVRSMGGVGPPNVRVKLKLRQAGGLLETADNGFLISDVVDGTLPSPYASITLRNNAEDALEITKAHSLDRSVSFSLVPENPLRLVPGQTRTVTLHVTIHDPDLTLFSLQLHYKTVDVSLALNISYAVRHRILYEPHKVTHLHPGGIVSYAILRPPARTARCTPHVASRLPVLLLLHGAGLEADSDLVAHALDSLPNLCAWVLFPTGVTPWSGDDWHQWGFADVEAAVSAVPDWIRATGWLGHGVDDQRWLVTGHSNGGQGAWYIATHRPDRVTAVAPVSGYSSIQAYVPYNLWHAMDPQLQLILDASMNSYRHEMLVENLKWIPIQQQHGSDDDNVPAYHSRLMRQLISQSAWQTDYFELPHTGHWFDGVMTTKPLRDFFEEQLNHPEHDLKEFRPFCIVTASPGDTGSKNGIRITQLKTPGQYGRICVSFDKKSKSFSLTTSNVLSFIMNQDVYSRFDIVLDGQPISCRGRCCDASGWELFKPPSGLWRILDGEREPGNLSRRGRQLGAMNAILRTNGPFAIIYHCETAFDVALQISRILLQYFMADSQIFDSSSDINSITGNIISLAVGNQITQGLLEDFPLYLSSTGLVMRMSDDSKVNYNVQDAPGAAFLRPLEDQRLELVVWGKDATSMATAARLIPMLTGVGQPDFVILGPSCSWRGVDGVMAMGFFDHSWNISQNSFFR